MGDPREVRAMFGRIAGRYDFLNRLFSAGIDRGWRRALVERLGELEGKVLVDCCCGTGDLALLFQERGAAVVGVDFAPQMLSRARAKQARRTRAAGRARGAGLFVGGDALALPIADRAADASGIAFGIRNVADRSAGIRELARVVREGGWVLLLEFSMPRGRILGPLYRWYFTRLLPRLGGWLSGDPEAYAYLPRTVLAWPSPAALRAEMEAAGLVECGFRLLSGGIACLSWGRVSARGEPGKAAR
jgi:demethylmenaquinone methyltransferase/2-methoxy-6-polyprenyl-1,4-benzoquinol methylase